MRIIKSFALTLLIGIGALTITSAKAATLTVDVGGQLIGATDLVVPDVGVFDVFFLDGSCAALFFGCDNASQDFDFTSQPNALKAGLALLGLISGTSFDTAPETTLGCTSTVLCQTLIPFAGVGAERMNWWRWPG